MYNYEKVINVLFYKSCDYSIYEISSILKQIKNVVRSRYTKFKLHFYK